MNTRNSVENTTRNAATFTDFTEKFAELRSTIGRVILGQEGIVEDLLIVVLAGGHALIEGAPGAR